MPTGSYEAEPIKPNLGDDMGLIYSARGILKKPEILDAERRWRNADISIDQRMTNTAAGKIAANLEGQRFAIVDKARLAKSCSNIKLMNNHGCILLMEFVQHHDQVMAWQ